MSGGGRGAMRAIPLLGHTKTLHTLNKPSKTEYSCPYGRELKMVTYAIRFPEERRKKKKRGGTISIKRGTQKKKGSGKAETTQAEVLPNDVSGTPTVGTRKQISTIKAALQTCKAGRITIHKGPSLDGKATYQRYQVTNTLLQTKSSTFIQSVRYQA